MHTYLLKLTDDKTEFIILSKKQQLNKLGDIEIISGNNSIHNTSSVRNLGLYYDSQLKNINHINKLRSTLFTTIYKISKIRHILAINTTKNTHASSGLIQVNYCNSLLLGTANCHLPKLQRIRNMACKLIYRKFDLI